MQGICQKTRRDLVAIRTADASAKRLVKGDRHAAEPGGKIVRTVDDCFVNRVAGNASDQQIGETQSLAGMHVYFDTVAKKGVNHSPEIMNGDHSRFSRRRLALVVHKLNPFVQ
jgi:hypothetical protein